MTQGAGSWSHWAAFTTLALSPSQVELEETERMRLASIQFELEEAERKRLAVVRAESMMAEKAAIFLKKHPANVSNVQLKKRRIREAEKRLMAAGYGPSVRWPKSKNKRDYIRKRVRGSCISVVA